jgi:hypothetical protein
MEKIFETRTMPVQLEIRADGKNEPVLAGLAAVYNKRSQVIGGMGGFTEIIEPGFFSGVMDQDVLATIEHNNERLVGRTKSGTLKISDSDEGLRTENKIPPTSDGNDLLTLVKRGDISGMSFKFRCADGGSKWESDSTTGAVTRTLMAGGCEELADITYTCDPAYKDTAVAERSMTEFRSQKDAEIPIIADIIKQNERIRKIKLASL